MPQARDTCQCGRLKLRGRPRCLVCYRARGAKATHDTCRCGRTKAVDSQQCWQCFLGRGGVPKRNACQCGRIKASASVHCDACAREVRAVLIRTARARELAYAIGVASTGYSFSRIRTNRAHAKLHRLEVSEMRRWALENPDLTYGQCSQVLAKRYGMAKRTIDEILRNSTWCDLGYQPIERPDEPLEPYVRLMLWLCVAMSQEARHAA